MRAIRSFLLALRWPPLVAALGLSTGAYFAVARWLQDHVLPVDRSVVSHKLSTFEILPEPYEQPLYLLAYLVVPLVAVVCYPWVERMFVAMARIQRRHWRLLAAGVLALGAVAVGLAAWLQWSAIISSIQFLAAYLERRGLLHALWLLLTKRLYAVRVALAVSLGVFGLLAWRWRNGSLAWWRANLDPRWLKRLEPWLPVVLAALIFDPSFPYQESHYNHVTATVSDAFAGKPFLYETGNQYGVLNMYVTLALFRFLPMSYASFSLVLALMYFVFFLGLYGFIRRWLLSRILAALGTLAAVATAFLIQGGPFLSPYSYPGTTSYRHGWFVVVAAGVLWWSRRVLTRLPWWRRDLPLQLAGIGALWNLDAGAAALLAVVATVVIHELTRPSQAVFVRVKRGVGVVARQIGYVAAVAGVVTLANRLVYGSWPNWSVIFDAMNVYSSGLAKLPLPAVGLFEVFVVAYLVAALAIARRMAARQPLDWPLVFLTGYGILSLAYYVGNSAWSYLYPVTVPLVLIILYGFSVAFRRAALPPRTERWTAAAWVSLLVLVGSLVVLKLPVEFSKRDYRGVIARLQPVATTPELAADAARLAREFPPGARPPLAHDNDGQLLLLSRRANLFPLYDRIDVVFDWHLQDLVARLQRARADRVLVGDTDFPYRQAFLAAIADLYAPAERWQTLQVYRRKHTP